MQFRFFDEGTNSPFDPRGNQFDAIPIFRRGNQFHFFDEGTNSTQFHFFDEGTNSNFSTREPIRRNSDFSTREPIRQFFDEGTDGLFLYSKNSFDHFIWNLCGENRRTREQPSALFYNIPVPPISPCQNVTRTTLHNSLYTITRIKPPPVRRSSGRSIP